jgi:hypothetical protein
MPRYVCLTWFGQSVIDVWTLGATDHRTAYDEGYRVSIANGGDSCSVYPCTVQVESHHGVDLPDPPIEDNPPHNDLATSSDSEACDIVGIDYRDQPIIYDIIDEDIIVTIRAPSGLSTPTEGDHQGATSSGACTPAEPDHRDQPIEDNPPHKDNQGSASSNANPDHREGDQGGASSSGACGLAEPDQRSCSKSTRRRDMKKENEDLRIKLGSLDNERTELIDQLHPATDRA